MGCARPEGRPSGVLPRLATLGLLSTLLFSVAADSTVSATPTVSNVTVPSGNATSVTSAGTGTSGAARARGLGMVLGLVLVVAIVVALLCVTVWRSARPPTPIVTGAVAS